MSGYGGLNRVDRSKKDTSGFTPQQRHDIILSTLSEFGKGPQAFQLRWRENSGELLTGETLLKTPMFWFMKYKWSRSEIEALFFKARVEIDSKFDMALQQTFGGDPGARWKGGGGVRRKNYRRAADVTDDRDWEEEEKKKGPREPDSVHGPGRDPNFEYNPVIQPVDFQATGGVDNKNKDPTSKEYGRGPWQRLPPKESEDPSGSGPKMGKGKMPSDPNNPDGVKLKPIRDYSKWKEPTGDAVFVINVECPDGKTLQLKCEADDPLHYVKKQIVHKTDGRYPEQKQILQFGGNELVNNEANLKSYGIRSGDTLQLSIDEPITVYVEQKNGKRIELKLDPHDTIAAVKVGVEGATNPSIPAAEQRLYRTKQREKGPKDNEFANNSQSLFKCGIGDGDVIYLGGPSVWRPPVDDGYPIFVECPDGKTLTLNVTAADDIAYTKLQVEHLTRGQYPVSEQILHFKRKELADDDATLAQENIVKNSVLQLSCGKIPIFVETREGKVVHLMVDPHELVGNVKQMVDEKTVNDVHYPAATQQLYNRENDEELADNARTLTKYGIVANSYLYLGGTIPVRIRKPDGSITRLDIDPNDPSKVMKQLMNKKEKIPINQQTLYFNNVELSDSRPSKHYGIRANDVIDLALTYPIFVQKPDKSRIQLNVSPSDSVFSIKERVEGKTHPSIPVAAQTLTFKSAVLREDTAPISKYGIVEDSVVYLTVDDDDPEALLEKILSRDAPANERLDALNKIHENVAVKKNKRYCDVLLAKQMIPLLLCGHGVQILDEEPVRRTAIENIPDIFSQSADTNADAAMGALDETLDSLFKIYDDPRCRKIHPCAAKAINRIVDDIVARNDPQHVNKLVAKLGEKVDLENISTPQVRKFAMQQLQKTMFRPDNELLKKIFDEGKELKQLPDDAPQEKDLAPKGSNQRKYFDTVRDDADDPFVDNVWKAINEMITDPNPDNKQIGLNLAALFLNKEAPDSKMFKRRLDGHARPIYQKWKFGPQKPYDLKMPPKGPKKKYKVDPLEPVDYRIKQQQGLTIGGMTEMPDL
eukprot:486596_1